MQLAENERRQSKEVVIQTIQKEKKQYQLGFAKNHLLVETLAKKQYSNTDKAKNDFDCMEFKNIPRKSSFDSEEMKNSTLETSMNKKKSNLNNSLKIHARRHKQSHQQPISIHNPVTLKHHPVVITKHNNASFSNNAPVPSCSNSKIYGMQSEEELQVPSDVLTSNKKSLEVEVCVAMIKDKRIGSAESAGSHDSINQEIHHFRPIKPALRTQLSITLGRSN